MRAVVRPKVVTVGGTSERQLPVLAAGRSRIVSARERRVQGLLVVRADGDRNGACFRAALQRAYVPSGDGGVDVMLAFALHDAIVAVYDGQDRDDSVVQRDASNLIWAIVNGASS